MRFSAILDRATAKDLVDPDWEAILAIIDAVRGKEVTAKAAVQGIRAKCVSENPHSVHHALLVLECVVKNCGNGVHAEVATPDFMKFLKDVTVEGQDKVREKGLELIQCWAHAFRNNPAYKIVNDTLQLMKMEGVQFPTLREADAMFTSNCPPEWVDADKCYRCSVAFSMITRKHHCRNCGQIFCDRCSSRQSILPDLGIEREVRVCETCFDKINSKRLDSRKKTKSSSTNEDPRADRPPSSAPKGPGGKTAEEIAEEEELALALAISQSEHDEQQRKRNSYSGYRAPTTEPAINNSRSFSMNGVKVEEPHAPEQSGFGYKGAMSTISAIPSSVDEQQPIIAGGGSELDNELARYLNRSYWEQRGTAEPAGSKNTPVKGILRQSPTPSAPVAEEQSEPSSKPVVYENGGTAVDLRQKQTELVVNGEVSDDQDEDFVAQLRSSVDVFVNRIKSNQARGRSIVADNAIQTLFTTLTSSHAELLERLQQLDDRRGYCEGLQDKLSEIKAAREAVTALREEHEVRRQQQQMEQKRQRDAQRQQKLMHMRQQKSAYLEQQRLLAIQRMQEQQAELAMRKQQMHAQAQQQAIAYAQQQQGAAMYQQQQPGVAPPVMQHPYQHPPGPHNGDAYNMQAMAHALPPQATTAPYAPQQHPQGVPQHPQGVSQQTVPQHPQNLQQQPHTPSQHPQHAAPPQQQQPIYQQQVYHQTAPQQFYGQAPYQPHMPAAPQQPQMGTSPHGAQGMQQQGVPTQHGQQQQAPPPQQISAPPPPMPEQQQQPQQPEAVLISFD